MAWIPFVVRHPTLVDWFKFNTDHYGPTLFALVGVHATGFNVLLLFAIAGLAVVMNSGDVRKNNWLERYVPLFVAVLPVFLWPAIISRILFIQFLLFVPLGLCFVMAAKRKNWPVCLRRACLPATCGQHLASTS